MAAHSRSPIVNSVVSTPELLLRGSWAPVDISDRLQNLVIEDYPAALCATSLRQILTAEAPEGIIIYVSEEEEIEEELAMSENEYVSASDTLYAISEDLQQVIETAAKLHEKI